MGSSPHGTAVPRVSVIVPVRDRRALLSDLLDALAKQTIQDYEVIVVDDGSIDGSDVEASARAAAGAPIVVLHSGRRGAVAARSVGVAAARAEVLAFTDSDCVPEPDWLDRGLAAIDAGADVVQGRTEPVTVVRPLERTVWVTFEDGLYATCNVFYRRTAFDAAGGFDQAEGERLGFRPGRTLRDLGFGEDSLLGWRVRREGTSAFAADAVVRHHVFPADPVNHVRRALNAGGFPMLVAQVPELRRVFLRHGLVLGAPTRVPLYAAAVVVGRSRRAAALAIAAWVGAHVWQVRRAAGTPTRKAASLPVLLAGDAVTAASLMLGSVRAREIVL